MPVEMLFAPLTCADFSIALESLVTGAADEGPLRVVTRGVGGAGRASIFTLINVQAAGDIARNIKN